LWGGDVLKDAQIAETTGAGLISARMAKALSNPTRADILARLRVGPMSPSQFVEAVGGDLSNTARYFRQLHDWGLIELAETRSGAKRRGGVEHVYRLAGEQVFDLENWAAVPLYLREDISHNVLKSFFERVEEARRAKTFDEEPNRHLSWDARQLDREAFDKLTERLNGIVESLPDLEAEAAGRMEESGEIPIPVTIGMASFRSPATSGRREANGAEE
jgi:DNA-binding transcriptional ArsR family regulator